MAVILAVLLVLGAFLTTDCSIDVYTPNLQQYKPLEPLGVNIQSATHVCFSLMAGNDAHVGLYEGAAETVPNQMYEIVIGGWGNGQSVIRTFQQGSPIATASHNPLSSSSYKDFWISWNTGIRVGSGSVVGTNEFLYANDNTYQVTYIAIFTAFGSDGNWKFADYPVGSSSSPVPSSSSVVYVSSVLIENSTPSSNMLESSMDPTTLSPVNTSLPADSISIKEDLMNTQGSEISSQSTPAVPQSTSDTLLSTAYMSQTTFDWAQSTPGISMQLNSVDITPFSQLSVNPTISESEALVDVTIESTRSDVLVGNSTTYTNLSQYASMEMSSNVFEPSETAMFVSSSVMAVSDTTQSFENSSIEQSLPSTQTNVTRKCSCFCTQTTISNAEIKIAIEKKLILPKTNLSSTRRKLSSAQDNRPSSSGIGSGIVLLVVVPLLLIILSDIQNIFVMFEKKKLYS